MHFMDKIAAGTEIPGLKDGAITCFLQLPGDPFGPELIRLVVADKKILRVFFSLLTRPKRSRRDMVK
jgi:hypothetical protein